jgi:hypothetical protein
MAFRYVLAIATTRKKEILIGAKSTARVTVAFFVGATNQIVLTLLADLSQFSSLINASVACEAQAARQTPAPCAGYVHSVRTIGYDDLAY